MKSKGYSLWLIPPAEYYEKYAALIKKLAEKYSGPIFQPHITLLGDFAKSEEEAIKLCEKIVSGKKILHLTMGPVDYQEFHFRALFIKAIITDALQGLHNKAKELFNMQNIAPYMPHLSILYGNYPQRIKDEIISQIGKEQPAEFEISKISLIKGGLIHEWKIIKEFNLE